ncbi:hypothetical protein AVEN_41533-1, partial [Araneus ventricosus]
VAFEEMDSKIGIHFIQFGIQLFALVSALQKSADKLAEKSRDFQSIAESNSFNKTGKERANEVKMINEKIEALTEQLKMNVDYYNAKGSFINPHEIQITHKSGKIECLSADNFVIAVGGRPKYPEIPGAIEYCISSDDIFSFEKPPEGKRLRHLKTQGSCKICPASIKVQKIAGNSCKVDYSSTHIGHKNDIDHLSITEEGSQLIASKIALKVPFDILGEIRGSFDEFHLNRVHLLPKKDLYNIENSYNIGSSAVKHKDDGTSVQIWINEMEHKGSIILFKGKK